MGTEKPHLKEPLGEPQLIEVGGLESVMNN